MIDVSTFTELPVVTPGAFVRQYREARHLTLEQVALMLETVPRVSARSRAEWLGLIEADEAPISLPTAIALHDAIGVDLRALGLWMAEHQGDTPLAPGSVIASAVAAAA